METQNFNSNSAAANAVSFETMPIFIGKILAEIEGLKTMLANPQAAKKERPKYVDINGAAEITSKTPNALRVQISLGNLKAFKRGARNYFETEYLENWLTGNLDRKSL